MGDRISIQFVNGDDKSVVLFSHWGGEAFFQCAQKYANDLAVRHAGSSLMPLHTALPHFMLMTDLERLLKDMHGDNVAKVVDGRLKEPKRRSALSPDEIYHVVIITFKRQRPDFLRADAAGIRKISG